MTYEEAEKVIYEMICLKLLTPKEDEALHIAYQAVKKQIPKKIVWKPSGDGLPRPYCSVCGSLVIYSGYCDKCGQQIYWSEVKK